MKLAHGHDRSSAHSLSLAPFLTRRCIANLAQDPRRFTRFRSIRRWSSRSRLVGVVQMGNQHSRSVKEDLAIARSRLTKDIGAIQVSARYHQLPKRIEQDYVLHASRELGHGFNGAVYMATSLAYPSEQVAVKPFKLFGLSRQGRRALRNEVELFLAMDHPHIAQLIDVYEGATELTLVMERLNGGELFDRVHEMRVFTESNAANTAWMMLLAINYLHSKDIVHRDIKLENFLYDSTDYRFLKLIDFGFSRFHRRSNRKMQLGCGTAAYMAPEVIENSYDRRCDMWSTGVVVFILLMGYMPFAGSDAERVEKIRKGKLRILEAPWSRLSLEARDFVQRLLTVDPNKRMTAEEALDHEWLKCRDPAEAAVGASTVVDAQVVSSLRNFAAASKFRRACLSMMAWSLSNQQRAEVRKAFIDMDRDRRGTISLFEFKEVLQSQVSITDSEVLSIFNALTAECEDEIEYSDFLAAMVASRIQVNDDLLRAAFKRFDVDGTGTIGYADMREVLGEVYAPEELERLMKEVDASGDGEIQLEEFVDYMRGGDAPQSHIEVAATIIEAEEARQRSEGQPSPLPREATALLTASFEQSHSSNERSVTCCVL